MRQRVIPDAGRWTQVPRKIANRMRGTEELTLESEVLLLLAGSLLRLCAALEERGQDPADGQS